MACGATLKRSRELDPLLSPDASIKRRRTSMNSAHCTPLHQSFHQHSPNHDIAQGQANISFNDPEMPSAFENSVGSKNSQDDLDVYLHSEIRMLRRRRMLGCGGGNESPISSSSDSESEQRMDSAAMPMGGFEHGNQETASRSSAVRNDRRLFSYKQVRLICERLMKEQEKRLREEYDRTLNAKLAEQHETFVRFTYDQIHRRLGDTPMTYLS